MLRYLVFNEGFPNNVYYGSTYSLFNNQSTFLNIYGAVFLAQLTICIVYLIIIALNENMPYNKLLNPITTFGVAFFVLFLIVRMGAIMKSYYYPS